MFEVLCIIICYKGILIYYFYIIVCDLGCFNVIDDIVILKNVLFLKSKLLVFVNIIY